MVFSFAMIEYICYIDESGDHSMNSQTRWLCLTGIVMESEYAKTNIPYQFDIFKQYYNIANNVLHLSNIKNSS